MYVLWFKSVFSDSFIYGFIMCYDSNNLDTSEIDVLWKNVWRLKKAALVMTNALISDTCGGFK